MSIFQHTTQEGHMASFQPFSPGIGEHLQLPNIWVFDSTWPTEREVDLWTRELQRPAPTRDIGSLATSIQTTVEWHCSPEVDCPLRNYVEKGGKLSVKKLVEITERLNGGSLGGASAIVGFRDGKPWEHLKED